MRIQLSAACFLLFDFMDVQISFSNSRNLETVKYFVIQTHSKPSHALDICIYSHYDHLSVINNLHC